MTSAPAEDSIRVELTIKPGDSQQTHSISFDDDQVTLGRSSQCDIQVPFPVVSSHHLTFVNRDGRYWVRDEGSTNGTKLDLQMLEPGQFVPVDNGTRLQIVNLSIDIRLRKPTEAVQDFTLAQTGTMAREMLGEALEGDQDDLAFFEIANGDRAGERIRLPDELDSSYIGSADECIVQIHGPGVAPRALKITYGADGFAVAPNGDVDAWHNGSKLESRIVLASGDRVTFNKRSLLFHDPLESQLHELEGLGEAVQDESVRKTVDAEAANAATTDHSSNTDEAEAVDPSDVQGQAGDADDEADDTENRDPVDLEPASDDTEATGGRQAAQTGQQPAGGPSESDAQEDAAQGGGGWGLMEVFLLLVTLVFLFGVTLVLLVTFGII